MKNVCRKSFWGKQNNSKFFRRLNSIWVTIVALLCTSVVIYMLKISNGSLTRSPAGESYADGAGVLASVLINVTNKAIQRVLASLSEFEHHGLRTRQSASYILKSFVATTLNSAVVVCLSDWNLNLPWNHDDEQLVEKFGGFEFRAQRSHHITSNHTYHRRRRRRHCPHPTPPPHTLILPDARFYKSVGSLIVTTMAINAIMTPAGEMIQAASRRVARHRKAAKCRTQFDLTDLYRGNSFRPALRYCNVLMTIYICLGLGMSMPILYPIATITFIVIFNTDKYILLRVCRKPMEYSQHMATVCTVAMLFAAPIHLMMAITMTSVREASNIATHPPSPPHPTPHPPHPPTYDPPHPPPTTRRAPDLRSPSSIWSEQSLPTAPRTSARRSWRRCCVPTRYLC